MIDDQFSIESASSENWFAAQLKPNALSIATRHLQRQGFNIFCPKRLETRRVSNKSVTRPCPLFPGYLFVQFDPRGQVWRKINSTRGVSRLILSNPVDPTPLPRQFIAGLGARCDEDGMLKKPDEIKAGDRIRIVSGPFAEFVTKVEHVTEDKRLQVLLSLMGQSTRVFLPDTAVAKAVDA